MKLYIKKTVLGLSFALISTSLLTACHNNFQEWPTSDEHYPKHETKKQLPQAIKSTSKHKISENKNHEPAG